MVGPTHPMKEKPYRSTCQNPVQVLTEDPQLWLRHTQIGYHGTTENAQSDTLRLLAVALNMHLTLHLLLFELKKFDVYNVGM